MADMTSRLESMKEAVLPVILTDHQAEQMVRYYDLLMEANQTMNLTTITDYEDALVKHFADSLSLYHALPELLSDEFKGWNDESETGSTKIIDVGTGCGMPGLPLKIAYPFFNVTLADSLQKRIRFLNQVCESLDLNEINTIHGRAEELGKNITYREQYDVCVARAVANLSTLSELCLPFVSVGGIFAAYKGYPIEDEIDQAKKAIHLLGGKIEKVERFKIGNDSYERSIVLIRKTSSTPKRYPRRPGLPSKEPLT